ncbi:hypothetical protein SAMN02746041_00515 [Desulfacinum hydrothermale DSM 13146]|uniref:Uncharacterized protein n=1 Tax=Desulfacinum hydrothermale DSM 13146 TaxID=1121390 RepID=A0A1W1X5J5_9BACT|nr:hypothetical protein [Desulfacinum hydrothermale]SMC18741.1 hypothetical protein SAMN02746041_00515 [Desulfacinum hydrothermale DSM 13146]
MKKGVVLFIILFFLTPAYSADHCLEVARRLWALQNQIVAKSFRQLPPGAWAQYASNIKAVYLGQQVSPRTGMKLHVIEFTGGPTGQIWYQLTPKDIPYQGETLRFWTLEPMEAYILMGHRASYISKRILETYMRMSGNRWSTILEEGTILSPPNCDEVPEIRETTFVLASGKKVKATVIRSQENGAKLYCSPDVPFGWIKVKHSDGTTGAAPLMDFGFSGARAKISRKMAAEAQPIVFPASPLRGPAKR